MSFLTELKNTLTSKQNFHNFLKSLNAVWQHDTSESYNQVCGSFTMAAQAQWQNGEGKFYRDDKRDGRKRSKFTLL